MSLQNAATTLISGRPDGHSSQLEAPNFGAQTPHQLGNRAFNDVTLAEAAFKVRWPVTAEIEELSVQQT